MVSGSISLPCSGFFSPFPHGTGSLSLTRLYLALADGPACFRQDSSCLAVLRILLGFTRISLTGLAPSSATLPIVFCYPRSCHLAVLQPHHFDGLGSSRFARRYSGNHSYFLLLRVLRCFSSPRTSHMTIYSSYDDWSSTSRVPPFGYLRLFAP